VKAGQSGSREGRGAMQVAPLGAVTQDRLVQRSVMGMLDWIRRTLGLPPRGLPVEATTAPPSKPDRGGEDQVPVPSSEVSPAWDDPRLRAILPHREELDK
jgi:hypothetical protein